MTPRSINAAVLSAILLAGLTACSSTPSETPTAAAAPEPLAVGWEGRDWQTFTPATRSDVYLGGQPSEQALDAFIARGGTTIINLRTPREMEPIPAFEQAVRAKGLTYEFIPTSGSTLTPEHAQRIAEAVESASGPVMLHCASGGRATYAWAMHLVDAGVIPPAEATAWAQGRRNGSAWETGTKAIYAAGGATPPGMDEPEAEADG
ncbi:MAG: sulfur transferase domain-containing protein [Planctomycetota bacterium]